MHFLIALVFCMGSRALPQTRNACEAEIRAAASSFDRYVDMGVTLHVVTQDPEGRELIAGAPKVRILRTHHRGGIIDTKAAKPFICGPSRKPAVWYCSEDQEQVLLHADAEKLGQLVYGSEGAGKTSVLAMWHVFNVLAVAGEGKEGGQTAPTEARMAMIRAELFRICRPDWFTYSASDDLLTFCDGSRIRLVSTYRKSQAAGSPVQGYNWSWCGQDEGQDQLDARDDIESRGRSAYNGRYHQLITATAKDDSNWRNVRDALQSSGLWLRRTMLGTRSPFIHPQFWEQKRRTMDPREYARRVLAQDVGIELAAYFGWQRDRNLLAPQPHAIDVTQAALENYQSRHGGELTLLVGHDPGSIYNTSVVLKLLMHEKLPRWFVVGELQTKQTDNHAHALALIAYLQKHFDCENGSGRKAAVFCDPHGKGDAMTDYQTVYTAFNKHKLDIFTPSVERISRKKRVAMVNRLMGDSDGYTNLYVALDQRGMPAAPILVSAFETLEKPPGGGNPEGVTRKDATDMTHAPASLGYALHPFERELINEDTRNRALRLARRLGARV